MSLPPLYSPVFLPQTKSNILWMPPSPLLKPARDLALLETPQKYQHNLRQPHDLIVNEEPYSSSEMSDDSPTPIRRVLKEPASAKQKKPPTWDGSSQVQYDQCEVFSHAQTLSPATGAEAKADDGVHMKDYTLFKCGVVNAPFPSPVSGSYSSFKATKDYMTVSGSKPFTGIFGTSLEGHTSTFVPSETLPSFPPTPTAVRLGKREAESEYSDDSADKPSPGSFSSCLKRGREDSIISDTKAPKQIQILPLPLPSKRFKKNPSKALLIPVEQLPVYALPPMPYIDNPELLEQVFTHKSLYGVSRGKFEDSPEDPSRDYEKLEHVGDSILGVIVTTWLHETKPNLTIGTATKLKAHLVSNATLSHLSGLYNLPQRLRGPKEILPVLRAQTDVRAALMEAYIAGLYFSYTLEIRLTENGIGKIDKWLREMYEPLYDFFYSYMKKEFNQHHYIIGQTLDGRVISADSSTEKEKDELIKINEKSIGMYDFIKRYCDLQEPKLELNWKEEKFKTNQGSLWRIKCLIDGFELSESIRPFRKLAQNVAGYEAAKRIGLLDEFQDIQIESASMPGSDY
ncbi:uncharacterized protein L201_000629 [Kwoniella dendrophila CBS 6074]|uniref:RNase III domain-containing protein n=1 Tax=Kwoniella dendrophila CBS 6074 TaxID=1295534 RepID=A0AAX4JLP9_9TREE